MSNQLVVMRLKNMHAKHPQQDDSKVCSKCGTKVGIYPSGQKVLKKNPSFSIICDVCIGPIKRFAEPAPGAIEEAIENRRMKKLLDM
jgi:hypothetical protein